MDEDHLIKPPPSKEEIAEKAVLLTSVFKQLVALNASAIGLVVIFMDRFASDDGFYNAMVAIALLVFLGSLLASFLLFFRMTTMQKPEEGETLFEDTGDLVIFWVSFMGFTTGVLCLIVVAWFNVAAAMPWLTASAGLGMLIYAGYLLGKRLAKLRKRVPTHKVDY